MDILAVIPARGGSKGIPRKNIRLLNGKPLIYYSIKTALSSKYNLDVSVSSKNFGKNNSLKQIISDHSISRIIKKYEQKLIHIFKLTF